MIKKNQKINLLITWDLQWPHYTVCCKVSEINKEISQIELNKKFPNVYKFYNGDHNKLSLLLRKGVYPYENMDSWKRFNETELPDKESFY